MPMIIFNVYATSSDADLSIFNECIHDLEEVNRVDNSTTTVIFGGDLKAHLSTLRQRASYSNSERFCFVIDRKNLFVASH